VLLLHPIGSAALFGLFAPFMETLNLRINCRHEYPAGLMSKCLLVTIQSVNLRNEQEAPHYNDAQQ